MKILIETNRVCSKCGIAYHSCGGNQKNVLCPECRKLRKSTEATKRWMEKHKNEINRCIGCGKQIDIRNKRCYRCNKLWIINTYEQT